MAATIDVVLESMQKTASDTNAAKVTIGWETLNCGYMEVVYYAKKPKGK